MTYLAVLVGKKWRLTGKSESQVDHKRCCSNGQSVGNSTPPGTVLVGKVAIDRKILWITGRPQTMLQCRSKRWKLHAAWNLDTVSAVSRPAIGVSCKCWSPLQTDDTFLVDRSHPYLVQLIGIMASSSRPAIGVSCKCWSPLQTDDTFLVDRSHPYLESIRCPKGYQYQVRKIL
jgi:hypothetical protein